jgi:hypothetical protein
MSALFRHRRRSRFFAGNHECALERVACRRNEKLAGFDREPRLDRGRQSADQCNTWNPACPKPGRQRINVSGRFSHEIACLGISARGMLDHQGRESGKIARSRARDPAHDFVRVGSELRKQRSQHTRPGYASVMSPQCSAERLAPKPRSAALVGRWKAPTADAELPPVQLTPADRTGADDNHTPISISMRTDACRLGVGRNDNRPKWMPMRPGSGQVTWLARPGEGEASDRPLHVGERQSGFREALPGGCEHAGKAFFDPKAKVCGTRNSFA